MHQSSFSEGQSWGALKLCWKGFKIAKAHKDKRKMTEYAGRIRRLQKDLGLKVSKFPDLGLQ